MGKRRRSFSPEFKFQVLMDLLTGRKRRVEILREHQLSDSPLGWCFPAGRRARISRYDETR